MTDDVAAARGVVGKGALLRGHAAAALALSVFVAGFDALANLPLWPATPDGRASGLEWLGYNLVIVPSFFLSLFVAAIAAEYATDRGVRYIVAWTTAVVTGCLVATTVQWLVLEYIFDWNVFETRVFRADENVWTRYVLMAGADKGVWTRQQPVWMLLTWSIPTVLATVLYAHWRRAMRMRDRLYATERDRAERERQVLETQLRATQARVEPQFLFDTLARIKTLQGSMPSRATAQLDGLIRYLRAALPQVNETHSTLARELELCRAYFDIEKAARDGRCSFVVESPEALASASLAPMVLLPIVARAIAMAKPGAELSLRLRAELDRDHLRIELTSVPASSDARSAIPEEIRDRLVALYRHRAHAHWEVNDDQTRVTLELPLGATPYLDDSSRISRRAS